MAERSGVGGVKCFETAGTNGTLGLVPDLSVLGPLLTPALIVALFAWLLCYIRELRRETTSRHDALVLVINKRFDDANREMNRRFDEVKREMADQRERMARLEGSLDGFLAGRRDRDAA